MGRATSTHPGDHVPDIFDEVSEDLRAERARALLRRYGFVLVGLMLLTLAGVGLYDYQQRQTARSSNATAQRFIDASDAAARQVENGRPAPPALTGSLAELATRGSGGYAILAGLQLAALDWDAGRHDAAIATWTRLSQDSSAPLILRQLATLTSVQHQVDTGDAKALKAQLAPLITPTNQWRPLAEQVTALLDIRLGRMPEARAIMKSLTTDPQAPQGVRQMAEDLLMTMDGTQDAGAGPHG